MEKGSLNRIIKYVKKSGNAVLKTAKNYGVYFASIVIIVAVMVWGLINWFAMYNMHSKGDTEVEFFGRNAIMMEEISSGEATTAIMSSTTTFTTKATTTTTVTTTKMSTTTNATTTTATSTAVTTTETITTTTETDNEDVVEYEGVEQYIDPEEYTYLAQVIEHEGANCETGVKERIGICLVNRTYAPGFADSISANKEAPGQYFSGWYDYSEESATIAMELISAYNNGTEYWSQFCVDRGLTADTVYQRNDYAVPGTQEVYRETASTSGGYIFTLVYSR